ncbi:hypothetical protein K501DRAFT_277876 [Backusella circina FSU 941]|nr:hypothetical protein K501DRAFT_277876 [Backusella circina FSU 941]
MTNEHYYSISMEDAGRFWNYSCGNCSVSIRMTICLLANKIISSRFPIMEGFIGIEHTSKQQGRLVISPGSSSASCGCNATTLAKQGGVCVPTLENDTAGFREDKTGTSEEDSSDNTIVDNSLLVSNDLTIQTSQNANNLEGESEVVISRMDVINSWRKNNGIDANTTKLLDQKTRKSTQKNYDNGWKHWTTWCNKKKPPFNPVVYDEKKILDFLIDNKNFSTQHLNTLRSSIASVFSILHSNEIPIAEQPLIKDFFTSKRKTYLNSTLNNNSIFSTEKGITSEIEVESTGICLGTTTHTSVDETKTEDVIHTRPWYRSLG